MAIALALAVVAAGAAGCIGKAEPGVLRLGYFPNLAHAQALLGVATGSYQEALGPTRLETMVFQAGAAAIEALLSGRVDVVYVGPSPTINAISRIGLDDLVVVAGAASGGALFVVRPEIRLETDADYAGKTFATPQFGNTQDVALRHHLLEHGHTTTDRGGQVHVIPAQPSDIMVQFELGRLDGAWLAEPWGTRLIQQHGGKLHLDEADGWPDGLFVTAHVLTTRTFLASHGEDVRRLLAAHQENTRTLQNATDGTREAINRGIGIATGRQLGDDLLQAALQNIVFTDDPLPPTFHDQYAMAVALGFAQPPPPGLDRLWDLSLLGDP